ncbi:MAG TPA: AAA family ATPase [Leadbetterella sp.]|nr:AAA family ATPase [Leadbetterella sp.]
MYFKRLVDRHLVEWKDAVERKPLLLRGARQVGKSSAVKNLAKQFDNFVEVNFEENPGLIDLFDGDLNPQYLIQNLSIFLNQDIIPHKTLLFFDEIQVCPRALASLRFFYEKMPELHLVAAGSLLEFALSELPTFGVGRIKSIFMYPFSFDEFLDAMGEEKLVKAKNSADITNPLPAAIHQKLIDFLKVYLLVGGMPEAVGAYAKSQSLLSVQLVLDELFVSLKADFVKYKKRVPAARISEIFDSVISQSGGKFVYSKVGQNINHGQAKETLELLIQAGLVYPVTHTSANGIPLGAESDPKKRKMILFDTGIFQRILGLNISDFLFDTDTSLINKGAIAEQFWALEYLKYNSPFQILNLYYWHRENPNANAELDYVIQKGSEVLPIEVKSSGKGSMQSLRQFLSEKNRPFGYRFSLENYSEYQQVKSYPLYGVKAFLEE